MTDYILDKFEEAVAHFSVGQNKKTLDCCKEILKKDAENIEALNLSALAKYNENEIEKSISIFQQALNIESRFYLHRNLADILFANNDYIGAIDHYQKALALEPNIPEIKESLQTSKNQLVDHFNENFFIVTCHGWSGSLWFAHAMNLHEKIICTHSAMNKLASMEAYDEEKTVKVRKLARDQREDISMLDLFLEIRNNGRADAYGCVHTLRLRDVPSMLTRNRIPCQFMNLVRHPVNLVNSGFGQIDEMSSYDVFVMIDICDSLRNEMDFFIELAELYELNLCDQQVKSFLCACYHMMHLAQDLNTSPDIEMDFIKMETLTQDRGYYTSIIDKLTRKSIEMDDDYLDRVFQSGEIHKHRKGQKKLTAVEQYKVWEPWQQHAFSFLIEKSGIEKQYRKLGYDFSFLDRAVS